MGSDLPRAGEFTCSDPRINQLQSNISWGQRGNYLSIPTDCPQRDERLGWMGDAQVFVRTATMNADVAAFFTKWLVDVDDGQSPDGAFSDVNPNTMGCGSVPAWADAGVICPWTIYQVYGDRRILERHLPAMTRWVEWCREHSTGLIRDKDRGNDYGDWLAIGAEHAQGPDRHGLFRLLDEPAWPDRTRRLATRPRRPSTKSSSARSRPPSTSVT